MGPGRCGAAGRCARSPERERHRSDEIRCPRSDEITHQHSGLPVPTQAICHKRRTIPKDQLALALEGKIDEVYGYSYILTNLDVSDQEKLAEVEYWYRHRTDIEELNKNAKLGTALRHLPSADYAVNSVWMWASLLGCAISSWIQEITGLGHGNGRGRATVTRLRRELINIPARIIHRGGTIFLRPPPGENLLITVLPALQQLPRPG